ncbi:MAG: hypothetical protein M0Z39_05725 [Actinomycetota bacterium]|jgi:hypothetical protein|nr:hypothetical protein [Actinomycetota bacterium]
MAKNKTAGAHPQKERLRELENQIVLGGAEGDMRCAICEMHLPLPPIPLEVETWALALQATGRAHAVGHLIEEAQRRGTAG